jgi:hypothetical protein
VDASRQAGAALRLTLDDLRELCDRYVPAASRHPDSLDRHDRITLAWWPSHELGHLLTVSPVRIGKCGFGMNPYIEDGPRAWLAYDLAAMHVSKRLLRACGRADLFYGPRGEFEGANLKIVRNSDYDAARLILRRRRVLRLPHDRVGLESKLRRVVASAGIRGHRSRRAAPARRATAAVVVTAEVFAALRPE